MAGIPTSGRLHRRVLGYALDPARGALTLGGRVGRAASGAAADAAGRTALAGLDVLLSWSYIDEAVQRVLASAAADRAVGHALASPLVDAVARDVARYAVLERMADEVLESEVLGRLLERTTDEVLKGEVLERLLDRVSDEVLSRKVLERLLDRMLAEGVVERLADRVVDGPELERVVSHVIEGPMLDNIVDRLLEREELWRLVDEIARSPSVTEAISHQSAGFADQVAGQVRVHSQHADARLERVARRLLHRRSAPLGPADDSTGR